MKSCFICVHSSNSIQDLLESSQFFSNGHNQYKTIVIISFYSVSVCAHVCETLVYIIIFEAMTTQINMTKQPVKGEGGTKNKREEERLKPVKQHIQGFSF